MTHAVQISSLDFFSGTMWSRDEGRGVRGWLADNVSHRWTMGAFEVLFADETDAMVFRLWYGKCDDTGALTATC